MLSHVMPESGISSLHEWQECRLTIARFDGILADTRKYGFTLVTVLLTANALVTTSNPTTDRTAASIVVMALLLVLFMIDNYYWDLLRAAVSRAIAIESSQTRLSGVLSTVARRSHANGLILVVYFLFVVIAALIALVTALAAHPVAVGGIIALSVAVLVDIGAMLAVHAAVERASPISTRIWNLVGRWRTQRPT